MKHIAACALFTGAIALFGSNLWAQDGQRAAPQTAAQEAPVELRALLPAATLAGQSIMRVWGFDVYNASLWVAPGFDATRYAQHPFALELVYLRDFAGGDIAKRSLAEMRRQGPQTAAVESRWEAQMREVFPNVKARDRITGIHQPGVGAVFLGNGGRRLGEIRDPAFAKAFFGIWLSSQTSAPRLRSALLERAQTVAVSPAAGESATP